MNPSWKARSPSEETLKSLEQVAQNNDQTRCAVVQPEEKAWGWQTFRPTCLQWLNSSRWLMAVLFFLTIIQGNVEQPLVDELQFIKCSEKLRFPFDRSDKIDDIFTTCKAS